MPENALSELAEELKNVACEYADDKPIVSKAQRIVAELANFEPGRILGGRFDMNSLLNLETVYENCRIIAEERDDDEK